jgi:hypothetical protein
MGEPPGQRGVGGNTRLAPSSGTLAARLEERDRRRFAGRAEELKFLEQCLDENPPASVIHVTGPAGIGKSALLRAFARSARERDIAVIAIDGRELGPAPGALEDALREAARWNRGVVLLDSYERMTGLDTYLRRDLLPHLPDGTLVVIAGRTVPDPAWFAGGWEVISARLDLTALSAHDACILLASHGLSDERVPAIIDWAAGSPLALSLAAEAACDDPSWNAATDPSRPEILRSLIHRLVETELGGVRLPALAIAAVARTTTPQLLRAVLPSDEAEAAYQELCGLTVTEPLGDGITLHDLVRKALHADLRMRNSELERDLRRRIVDYLYARSIDGQPLMIIDMAHLVQNPVIRWGFGWRGTVGFRIDSVKPADAERVERQLGDTANRTWWQLTRRFFELAPDRVAVARDLEDQICGYLACMSQARAPAFADDDPLVGPWLQHARQHAASSGAQAGDSVLWHAAVDFTGQAKVQAMLGMAGVLRSGVANPRFTYLPIDPLYPGALEFAKALGAEHLAELDAVIGGRLVQCHRTDYGPGGLLAALRAQVYAELGLPAPALTGPQKGGTTKVGQPSPRPPDSDMRTVRDALKSFGVPRDLARSPFARGQTVQERADYARDLLRRAAADAFGDSQSERLLRSVLVTGYLDRSSSHEDAAARLCLSRAAYFRKLRTAVERLAEYLAEHPPD